MHRYHIQFFALDKPLHFAPADMVGTYEAPATQ